MGRFYVRSKVSGKVVAADMAYEVFLYGAILREVRGQIFTLKSSRIQYICGVYKGGFYVSKLL